MIRYIGLLPALLATSGCGTLGLGRTLGEKASAYGYIPLDPLPVDQVGGSDSCLAAAAERQTSQDIIGKQPGVSIGTEGAANILQKLPDQTIRFAVASFDQSKGSLTFGPTKLTLKGSQYRAVLDYIQADSVPVRFYVRKLVAELQIDGKRSPTVIPVPIDVSSDKLVTVGYEVDVIPDEVPTIDIDVQKTARAAAEARKQASLKDGFRLVTVPVYVGVGLRLSADVLALEGGITLAGLGAIGAEAEAKRISGTLTVQALRVNGKAIATSLPLPSKLDQTTIENAILAVGNMRATLYASSIGADGIWIQPRIVGLYSPIGSDPLLINAIYSELARVRPRWKVPCITFGPQQTNILKQ